MKIIIERKEWHAKRDGGIREEKSRYVFNNIENEKNLSWYEWGDCFEPTNICIKGAMPRELNFSLKVKKLNKDSVILEVSGEAGGEQKEDSFGYTSKEITLKLNENVGFATKTKDFGINYEVGLVSESEEKIERMSLSQFMHLVRMSCALEKSEESIYAPIVYNMEDKYYNACVEYLQNNTITHFKVGEIKIEDIIDGYWLDNKKDKKKYLEALIILNNIEKAGEDNAFAIFHPYIIE